MKKIRQNARSVRQRGQGMTEYIIIVAVIAIAAIGVFGYFGDVVKHQVAGMAQELAGSSGSGEQGKAGTSANADAVGAAAINSNLSTYHDNGTNGGG